MVKVSMLLDLLPGAAFISDVLSVAFYAKERNQLYDFISANSEIDYGCRSVIMAADGEANVCGTMWTVLLLTLHRYVNPRSHPERCYPALLPKWHLV
jgi:hypothetical protein